MHPVTPKRATPFRFTTKGQTLALLAPFVTQAKLCEQIIVPTAEWRRQRDGIIAEIVEKFADRPLAVRSSAAHEDGQENSFAGSYLSRINIEATPAAIGRAIDEVIDSYPEAADGDQALVQPMVTGVAVSGVVLTRDLDTGSPYYVVSYDDFSGRTDTVTGGAKSKTFLVHRARPEALHSSRFRKLIDSIIELEQITASHELDIEFCITETDKIYILQVRPLAARRQWNRPEDAVIDDTIENIRVRLKGLLAPAPGLAGRTTVLGEMPDWNPAEMIGTTPRPLALSLYKNLITDSIWAEARARMGYRPVHAPLLVDFCGRPYIDVRLSLNSFLPANLDETIAERLVNHQIAQLLEHHEFHDKIEFEIAVTCRDFTFEVSRQKLSDAGIGNNDLESLEQGLAKITFGALKAGAAGIESLVSQSNQLLSTAKDDGGTDPRERVRELLGRCRIHGTLPFSQLARHGFIAILFLKSLVARGVFSQQDAERFMLGIHTVAAELVRDMRSVAAKEMDRKAFLVRYGHLRPTTYDILSSRYDERPELYLGYTGEAASVETPPFQASPGQLEAIKALLEEFSYNISPEHLLAYITAAVKGREQAKFAFTRSISDAFDLLIGWGEDVGLSRDDLSFLALGEILEGTVGNLRDKAVESREQYKLTRAIRLPHLIGEIADIDVVRLPLGHPTFITSKRAIAKTVNLNAETVAAIDGHIVLIESADPGFDWIFSHRIEGLVTMYGGANSHMAIRCAEFGLPAAIGCGERLFKTLSEAAVIELNCAAGKLNTH